MLGKQGSKSNQWIFWIMINLTSLMEFRNFMVALPQSNKLIEEKRVIFPKDSSKRPMLKRFQAE